MVSRSLCAAERPLLLSNDTLLRCSYGYEHDERAAAPGEAVVAGTRSLLGIVARVWALLLGVRHGDASLWLDQARSRWHASLIARVGLVSQPGKPVAERRGLAFICCCLHAFFWATGPRLLEHAQPKAGNRPNCVYTACLQCSKRHMYGIWRPSGGAQAAMTAG